MSSFLTRLAERSLGMAPVASPRKPSQFEPPRRERLASPLASPLANGDSASGYETAASDGFGHQPADMNNVPGAGMTESIIGAVPPVSAAQQSTGFQANAQPSTVSPPAFQQATISPPRPAARELGHSGHARAQAQTTVTKPAQTSGPRAASQNQNALQVKDALPEAASSSDHVRYDRHDNHDAKPTAVPRSEPLGREQAAPQRTTLSFAKLDVGSVLHEQNAFQTSTDHAAPAPPSSQPRKTATSTLSEQASSKGNRLAPQRAVPADGSQNLPVWEQRQKSQQERVSRHEPPIGSADRTTHLNLQNDSIRPNSHPHAGHDMQTGLDIQKAAPASIEISIGRIEVRTSQPPAVAKPASAAGLARVPSLADYLAMPRRR
jgi:hypothetical protein